MPLEVLKGLDLECRSAIRWPRQLLEVKYDDYAGPIGPLPSYSPFPGEMNLNPNLNPIDDRAVGPAPSGDITIAVSEPIAHVRRMSKQGISGSQISSPSQATAADAM